MGDWRNNVRNVEPYVPGEQPKETNILKLNTNENPYPPAPGVEAALHALEAEALRRYPDPQATALVRAIAEEEGVSPEQVFVGVGSDDVLAMSFLTFFHGEKPILFPDVTYSFYPVWAGCFRIPYETVPLQEDWTIDPASYARENGGIVFANPNAPTSLALPLEGVRSILDANRDSVVIVDEAYVDFGGTSAVSLLPEYEQLLVVKTFSKSRSLAGMRIGYAIGNNELIRCLTNVRFAINSYTMSPAAIEAGVAAIRDREYFRACVQKIMDTRDVVKEELEEMGFLCADSSTNFLFVQHPEIRAEVLYQKLRERGIYIRYFALPRIDDHIRITIGTRRQMQVFLDTLRHILREERVEQ